MVSLISPLTINTVLEREGLLFHLVYKNAHTSVLEAFPGYQTIHSTEGEGYRVMVVRSPESRLLSCWDYFCNHDRDNPFYRLGYYVGMSFDAFLDVVRVKHDKDRHTRRQVDFTGGQVIDELIPIERLGEAWLGLRKRFPFLKPLPHRNRGPQVSAKPRSLDIYADIYADDTALYEQARNF